MAKDRQYYDEQMHRAETFDSPGTRKFFVEEIINRIRKDQRIKPLVLCAFLQDHAKLIKEISNVGR